MAEPEPVEVIRANVLAGLPHGFLGRRGGVSTGIVAGLNVGFGAEDDPEAVAKNRRRAAETVLPGVPLVAVHQVHSATCVTVEEPWDDAHRPTADALVTRRPGTLLGIVTADCAPVLMADVGAGVIGAAHAGWKGALAGVTDATISAMERIGARREAIVAAIGPMLAQSSFEVRADLKEQFGPDGDGFFAPGKPGHWQFDLEAYLAARLARARIERIERLGLDTYAADTRFYSFRRATHRGEPNYGRQFSLIGLPSTA